jgi:hypothetical protein
MCSEVRIYAPREVMMKVLVLLVVFLVGVSAPVRAQWLPFVYDAANFQAAPGSTWTVEPNDAITWDHYIDWGVTNTSVTVSFWIQTSSLSNPSPYLRIKMPPAISARYMLNTILFANGGSNGTGHAVVIPNDQYVYLYKQDGSNWSASNNSLAVFGQITFRKLQ